MAQTRGSMKSANSPKLPKISQNIFRCINKASKNGSGNSRTHWEVQALNAKTKAMYGGSGWLGVRTYNTLAEVEAHCKAFRGISAVARQALKPNQLRQAPGSRLKRFFRFY